MAGVLVIGGTGYIGMAVAKAARRDGFTVYAQTRSDSKAAALAAEELIPVVCDASDADALKPTVEKCEFIIECATNMEKPRAYTDACLAAIRACDGPKKHFLYTSGCLTHGSHPGETLAEDTIKEGVLSWRYDIEKSIVGLGDVDCTVLRPAFVYGGTGGFFAPMIFAKPDGPKLQVAGPDKIWSWVHIDDLADGYVRAMNKRSVSAARTYDLGEPFGPRYEDLKVAAAKLCGFDGDVEHVEPEGMEAFLDAGGTTIINPKRAREELGWSPRHTGIMAQLPLYYEAFKASKKSDSTKSVPKKIPTSSPEPIKDHQFESEAKCCSIS